MDGQLFAKIDQERLVGDESKLQFIVERNKCRILVNKSFRAAREKVWEAWTSSELTDKWWAPKPWKAETKEMNFREGGRWLYAMVSPEGQKHWAVAHILEVDEPKRFRVKDAFSDENGNVNEDLPCPEWEVTFHGDSDSCDAGILIQFPDVKELDKILEMGFKDGFIMALNNLDELLAGSSGN